MPNRRAQPRRKHWISVSSSGRRLLARELSVISRGGLNAWHPTIAGAEREAIEASNQEIANSRYPASLRALPNPSLEARPNGRPPGPGRRYAVHFRQPGPGVLPSVPPQLKR